MAETTAPAVTDSSPKPIVPVNPVSTTLAPAAANTSPTAVVPATPVTLNAHVPVIVGVWTRPCATLVAGVMV